MNCDDADGLLLDYVEDVLDAPQRETLDGHLSRCAACRERLRDTRRLLGALSEARQHHDQAVGRSSDTRVAGVSNRAAASDPAGAASASAAWRPGSRLGDFEILGEIGRGGMGVVFRARQVSLNRIVALKVLPALSGADEKSVARFVREAQAAARLHHTNIVPVYAQGEHDGHFYYAMELIDGESLDKVIRRWRSGSAGASRVFGPIGVDGGSAVASGTLPAGTVAASAQDLLTSPGVSRFRHLARLVCSAAEGLEHAHAGGVLHRDIKPQNLLLSADGQLHITDFGLARLLDEPGMTLTGEMVGTPAYMSPEQVGFGRQKIDHRTDVFSLGVTFYELLTLERPFDGATREQLVARICTREPRPPRKINASIPIDLETICLRAIEKDPARRFATAGAMAADLRRFIENRPIHARRVGPLEKAWKFVRRHPAMTTICVLCALLIAGAVTWRTQSLRARQERADELIARAFGLLAYDDYREPEEARGLLSEAVESWPDVSARPQSAFLVASGLSDLRLDPQQAVRTLQGALNASTDPTDRRRVLYLLAWAERQRTGRLDAMALKWLEQADAIGGPRSAEEHFFRGQALLRHRPEEAIGEFRVAREKRDNYAQAMLHLGRALNTKMYHARRHDTFDEQERVLLNACELQSTRAYPCYLLSITYRLSAEIYQHDRTDPRRMEEHFDAALKWAMEAQRRDPADPRGYACEAEYWEARRDYARAIDARDRGEPHCQSPDDQAEVCDYRWRLYYWTGQHERALADLERMKQFTAIGGPGQRDSRATWFAGLFPALVQMDMGEADEAAGLVVAAADAEPASPRAALSAAGLLRLLGRAGEAEALLDRAEGRMLWPEPPVESAPDDWWKRVYGLCRGRGTMEELETLVGEAGRREKLLWSGAYFYEGLNLLAAARRPASDRTASNFEPSNRRETTTNRTEPTSDRAAAVAALDACEQTFDYGDYCYAARVLLGRLERDASWPRQ